MALSQQSIDDFCKNLAAKQPTPGGGASAAMVAAIGAATAAMSAAYTQRKKDHDSGAAAQANILVKMMNMAELLSMADDDEKAYKDLQATWTKDCTLSEEEVKAVQDQALKVPTVLVEACHQRIVAANEFLPHCNPNITSDAKVGIHSLAGAARSAYQTVLVNSPPEDEKKRLCSLLLEIGAIEQEVLQLE